MASFLYARWTVRRHFKKIPTETLDIKFSLLKLGDIFFFNVKESWLRQQCPSNHYDH